MLDVFIEGKTADLAIPTLEFANGNIWYRWLNNPAITRYLADQGSYPNTREKQQEFFLSLGSDRIALVVQTKSGKPQGIVSFSNINFRRRTGYFAIFMDITVDPLSAHMTALEASALMLEHGIYEFGFERVHGGHHQNLARWQQRLELIGFRLEGIHRKAFVRGSDTANSVSIAATKEDVDFLRNQRGGRLFDSPELMRTRAENLPSESLRSKFDLFFSEVADSYYDQIFRL